MILAYASSPSHDVLRDYIFLGTLQDTWELLEIRFESSVGDYRSEEWENVIVQRARQRLQITLDNPEEIIVFADVDIQWFRPAQPTLLSYLNKYDCVFQQETPNSQWINGGFIALKSNERTIEMLQTALSSLESNYALRDGRKISDQATFNALISQGRMPCSFARLPLTFLNDMAPDNMIPPPEDVIMYHSVKTFPNSRKSSVQMKLEQHFQVRSYVLGTTSVFKNP